MGKRIGQGLLILVGLIVLGGIFGGSADESPTATQNEAVAEVDATEESQAPEPASASPTLALPTVSAPSPKATKTKTAPSITVAQENAIESAEAYLDFGAFSRTGLIDQLEYEGFSTADATFAVDYLDVDWFEQAAKSAQQYLDFSSFSRTGLIEQLLYEGFTREQATYGVDQTGL